MAHAPRHHSNSEIWQKLVDAATRTAKERGEGHEPRREPGRGRSNVWTIWHNGKKQLASIRTTQDRWFAFPRVKDGWKTLDKVDVVIVSAVDDVSKPTNAQVYFFSADEVRKCFDDSYNARIKARRVVRENFGMWISLDRDDRGIPASTGSGLAEKYGPVATYPLADLSLSDEEWAGDSMELDDPESFEEPRTISEILAQASTAIAKIAGVKPDKVRLDVKIEHG